MIPRIIHRVWLTPERPIPDEFAEFAKTWVRRHPLWEHRLWTVDCLPPLKYGDLFHRLKNFGQKADLLRYEILYRFGGIYVDTDFECLRPLEPILHGVSCFAAEEWPGRLCNAILGSTPEHPFFNELFLRLPSSLRRFAGQSPVEQTGPRFLTEVAKDRSDITRFPSEIFYPYGPGESHRRYDRFPGAYAVHHWGMRWRAQTYDRQGEPAVPAGLSKEEPKIEA